MRGTGKFFDSNIFNTHGIEGHAAIICNGNSIPVSPAKKRYWIEDRRARGDKAADALAAGSRIDGTSLEIPWLIFCIGSAMGNETQLTPTSSEIVICETW